jgi:hypothetical protein
MTDLANADLLHRIEELEAENELLRIRETRLATTPIEPLDGATATTRRKRGWGWTLLSAVLIAIGALLAPFAVAASWAAIVLTDTDRFVAEYAPLADDPEVQAYVTDETVAIINEQVDIPALTTDVIDGVIELGTGPAATQALELLKGPAASGIQSLIESGVTNFVASDRFSNVWQAALRVSHAQLIAALQNDPDAAIALGSDGTIGIQLGPIVDAVKAALLERGIDLASRIPDVDRTIQVAQSDALPTIQLAYGLVVAAGAWLPWIAILFLAAGVLVARRKAVALIWAALALALSMLLTLAAFAVGSVALLANLSPALVPASVAELLYDTVADDMRTTAIAVLVLAGVVALVAWFAGPFRVPRRLRGFAIEGASRMRGAAERRGITTGRAGVWMYTRRGLLRAAIAILAAAVVLFVRPLTPSLTIWTLVLAVLAVAILEVLQRPGIPAPATVTAVIGEQAIGEHAERSVTQR